MNASKANTVIRELTPTARKVFDCVPCEESWTAFQIGAELMRLGTPKDRRIVDGCLAALVNDGLVTRDKEDKFIRVPVKGKVVTVTSSQQAPQQENQNMSAIQLVKPSTAVQRLSALADRARGAANTLKALADEIDSVAVSIDDEIKAAGEGSEKLKQLQLLLKSLA